VLGAGQWAIATDADAGVVPIDWEEAVRLFAAERWYWVATTGDEGRPHLRPVLAVCLDERIYSTTSPAARKGRDLARRPSATLSARASAIDIVMRDKSPGSTTGSDCSAWATPTGTSTDGPSP